MVTFPWAWQQLHPGMGAEKTSNNEEKVNMYVPKPIDTSEVELTPDLLKLTDFLAENVHDIWAAQRMAEGWTYGPERNEATKKNSCLVPYTELPETEKEYDRKTGMNTLKAILALGYRINQG
jgi:ryanodine receptor 2